MARRKRHNRGAAASAPEPTPSAPPSAALLPPLVHVVGGNCVTTAAVLACLNTVDACVLRRLHPAMAAAVAEVPWADMVTVVKNMVRWRAALPGAVGVRLACLPAVRDAALARVTSMVLSLAGGVTDSSFAALPPFLRSLTTYAFGYQGEGLSFMHLTALESLDCSNTRVVDGSVCRLPPSLRELRINGCTLAPDADFSHLRSLRLLHNAGEHCELSATTIASLPSSLEELDVSTTEGYLQAWPVGVSLEHLTQLRVLRSVRRDIDDATMTTLPPSLTVLDVSNTYLPPDVSFAHLFHLQTLNARGSTIGDDALATLPPSLVSLDASECFDLTAAAVFPALPVLRVLNMSKSTIGDAAIASMPGGLTELRMADCKEVTLRADPSHLTALRALQSSGTDLSRASVAALRARGCAAPADGVLHGAGDDVEAMALLPSGRLVAAFSRGLCGTWNMERGDGMRTTLNLDRCSWYTALAVLPDGRHVAVGCRDSSDYEQRSDVVVWDTGTSVCYGHTHSTPNPARIDCHAEVAALVVTHDGTLVAGCVDGALLVLDVDTCEVAATLVEGGRYSDEVTGLAAQRDGTLASASADKTIRLWDVGAQTCVATLTGHTDRVCALAVLLSGLLASGAADRTVRLWDTASCTCVGVLAGHGGPVFSLATLPDGRLAAASWDGVQVWDTRGGAAAVAGDTPVVKMVEGLFCKSTTISTIVALPDGRLATGSCGCVRLWQLPAA